MVGFPRPGGTNHPIGGPQRRPRPIRLPLDPPRGRAGNLLTKSYSVIVFRRALRCCVVLQLNLRTLKNTEQQATNKGRISLFPEDEYVPASNQGTAERLLSSSKVRPSRLSPDYQRQEYLCLNEAITIYCTVCGFSL